MCADMVRLLFKNSTGRQSVCTGMLEDISPSGACLSMDKPMPLGATVEIAYRKGRLQGSVAYCFFREMGYWIGIEFDAKAKWSPREFRPHHLLDLKKLLDKPKSLTPRKAAQ